jgi:uncharacterized membrane protein
MSRRLDALDAARGLAFVAMAAYHLTWDLAYFGVVEPTTPFTPPMRLASHAIGATFLALAGFSLALAHGRGFRTQPFLKRLARIVAASALVTVASYAIAPQAIIGFGILHCIAAASLLAAPFLLRPGLAFAAGAAGAALIAAPSLWSSPDFNVPWLVWLGLGTEPPPTLDWRPLTPWGGFLLLGLAIGLFRPPLPGWAAQAAPTRALAFAGRHSLAFYLIHQPVMIALLWSALTLTGASERLAAQSYAKTCRPACVEAGGEIEACERACACVVRDAKTAGLGGVLNAPSLAQSQRQRLGAIVEACGADAR